MKDCLKTEIHTDKFAVFRSMMINQQLKRCNKKVTVNVLQTQITMDYLEIILMCAEYIDGRTNYNYFFEKIILANFLQDGRTHHNLVNNNNAS